MEEVQPQAPVPSPAPVPTKSAVEKVTLRHPLTGVTKVVDGVLAELLPLMGDGYQQVKESK